MNKGLIKEIKDWSLSLVIAIIFALLIKTFLFSRVLVEGDSMQPTLYENENMILNKIGLSISKLERGDIIVFYYTPDDKYFIKRVIGVPGDSVAFKDNQLYINSKKVKEPYLDSVKNEKDFYTYDFSLKELSGVEKIPKGKYFVLGDHRGVSKDSRIIGLIDEDEIAGKANLVVYPFKNFKLAK